MPSQPHGEARVAPSVRSSGQEVLAEEICNEQNGYATLDTNGLRRLEALPSRRGFLQGARIVSSPVEHGDGMGGNLQKTSKHGLMGIIPPVKSPSRDVFKSSPKKDLHETSKHGPRP